MPELVVRIDTVAALRATAASGDPKPATAAMLVELGGADGICAHLRNDRAHIQERDLRLIRETVSIPLILELPPTPEMIGVALNIKPNRVILVPEGWDAQGYGPGLDLIVYRDSAEETIRSLTDAGIPVGVFVDADPEQARIAHRVGADWVQVQTAIASGLPRVMDSMKLARKLRLKTSAGSDVPAALIKQLRSVAEIDAFVVGHSLMARALMVGISQAVRETISLLSRQ